MQNRLIQTSQTGGQWYSDTSPFSIPWICDLKIKGSNPVAAISGRKELKMWLRYFGWIREYLPLPGMDSAGKYLKKPLFQNLQESAESLIEMYNYNENLLLKDVPYVNLNRMQDLSEEVNTLV